MLAKIKQDAFWTSATLPVLDDIRCRLRELMQYLKKEMKMKVINVTDSVLLEKDSGNKALKDIDFNAILLAAESGVIGKLLEVKSAGNDVVEIVIE
jgi:hypothetical protein